MEAALIQGADIAFVRRRLDDLAVARSLYGWTEADREDYQELCRREKSLLRSVFSFRD
jgi:hypothetical protein